MTLNKSKPNNLLVHIGYHKTGTTWLRQRLFTDLSANFVQLSSTSGGHSHSTLARLFIYDANQNLLSPFDDNKEAVELECQRLFESFVQLKGRVPVITHERLSGNPHSGGFDAKTIAHRLKVSFPEAKVFIVIREQKSFILSSYFQYLSIGGMNSLWDYMTSKYDGVRPHFSPNHINFLPLVLEYCKLFDRKNVLVLPYEMFNRSPQNYILQLGKFVDRDIQISEDSFLETYNKKDLHFARYYLRYLNLLTYCSSVNGYSKLGSVLPVSIHDRILGGLGSVVPGSWDKVLLDKLNLQINTYVGDRYNDSNATLGRLIGINLSDYGYA